MTISTTVDDLPRGWTDEQDGGHYRLKRRDDDALFGYAVGPHSWKKFLHPPLQRLWSAERDGDAVRVVADGDRSERFAFIGVRACELHAIAIQDRVFLGGPFADPHYQARREGAFIVAVNCGQAGGTCFCVSMETGPKAEAGFDLALTEIIEDGESRFLVEAGTEAGATVLARCRIDRATTADMAAADGVVARTAASMGRDMPDRRYPRPAARNLEHPRWDDVAERCLTCGNCTMVCPTCFCTTVEDTSDLTGAETGRERRWDSCFTMDFSYIHGGSVRASGKSRYRQWMTHKLATWFDQFGTSGCVGCGRCITWCPVGIDITEEVRAIQAARPTEGRSDGGARDWRGSSGSIRSLPGSTTDFVELVVGCAKNVRFDAGKYLFREGDPADQFYLIREGRVALEIAAPGRGAVTFQTVGEGEIVGVSWLFPPYRWTYDARALELVRAIGMDATCLRDKCEADHDLGYEMMKRFVPILVQRLQATRCRCSMSTGSRRPDAWCEPAAPDPMVPQVARVAPPAAGRCRRLHARDRPARRLPSFAPGQFNMLTAFGVGEVAISISGDPAEPERLVHTIRAVGAVSRALTELEPGDALGLRGPFGVGWPMAELDGKDVVVVAGGLGLAPLRPAIYRPAGRARALRQDRASSTARAVPADILFRRELETLAHAARRRHRGDGRSCRRRLARPCRRGDDADPAGGLRSGQDRRPGLRARGHDALRRARR